MRRLNRVDLPMFGRPTIAMSGSEDGMKSSLSFCTIAHQIVLDLSCLPVIYSRIIETDRTFENQVIGSGRGNSETARRLGDSGTDTEFLKCRIRCLSPNLLPEFPRESSSDFLFGGPTARNR